MIRNVLADLRVLDMIDSRHWFSENDGEKGQAMRWQLASDYCCDLFTDEVEEAEEKKETSCFAVLFRMSLAAGVPYWSTLQPLMTG